MLKQILTTLILAAIISVSSMAQAVRMVKDIIPGAASTFDPEYGSGILLSFRDKILFIVKDANNNSGLWISNGEEDSTFVFHQAADNETFERFINDDSENVYYIARNDSERKLYSLSKSTFDTTFIFTSQSNFYSIKFFKNELYFAMNNGLWKLNPETKQSELIYQFGSFRGLRDMNILNDKLVLIGGESDGTQLYLSDGTTEGTAPYFQLNTGNEVHSHLYMTATNDKMFFFYELDIDDYSLWVTDGTAAGTTSLIKIKQSPFTNLTSRRSILGWNGKLYFKANPVNEPSNSEELFVSDGTVAGTKRIQFNNNPARPDYFTPYKNRVYFACDVFGNNYHIYNTNGTDASTIRAINPPELGEGGFHFGGQYMVTHKNLLYFNASRYATGYELWSSGGTTGTTNFYDIIAGSEGSYPNQLISTDNYLFMVAETYGKGRELHVLDPLHVPTSEVSFGSLTIFPNPFKDQITVTFDETLHKELEIEIFNIDGKVFYQGIVSNNQTITLSSVPSGSYVVMLKDGDKIVSRMAVKN